MVKALRESQSDMVKEKALWSTASLWFEEEKCHIQLSDPGRFSWEPWVLKGQ